jgi:hypothetical protein
LGSRANKQSFLITSTWQELDRIRARSQGIPPPLHRMPCCSKPSHWRVAVHDRPCCSKCLPGSISIFDDWRLVPLPDDQRRDLARSTIITSLAQGSPIHYRRRHSGPARSQCTLLRNQIAFVGKGVRPSNRNACPRSNCSAIRRSINDRDREASLGGLRQPLRAHGATHEQC